MLSRLIPCVIAACIVVAALGEHLFGQRAAESDDPVKALVARLDLERYKSTIKALTQFGDRREGTDRNRASIDWIAAQLKSYGCSITERLKYDYQPRPQAAR